VAAEGVFAGENPKNVDIKTTNTKTKTTMPLTMLNMKA
jgi:hypothetical protein